MSGKNEKYVVFKREDWDMLWSQDAVDLMLSGMSSTETRRGAQTFANVLRTTMREVEVNDAVVIRRQDVFSPGMLAAYAHSIQIAIKVAGIHEVGELNATGQRLRRIADYFHEQSELAYDESYKIPD